MARGKTGERVTIKRVIPKREATRVYRGRRSPWRWPKVVQTMTSNSGVVLSIDREPPANNGGPLPMEYAVNFLDHLYKHGYAVVEIEQAK